MAQNITLMGASYADVPSVELPKTGGGTATFTDTSDANATASDILTGKTAYVDGVKLTGTGSGGGGEPDHWVRPSDMPDLGSLGRLTGQELYFTYKTNDPKFSVAYFGFVVSGSKPVTVEEGQIVNGQFVASETSSIASRAYFTKFLTGYDTDYTVFRITSEGNITDIYGFGGGGVESDAIGISKSNQYIVEVYMSTPNGGTNMDVRNSRFRYTRCLRSVTWFNCPIKEQTRTFEECISLENAYIESTASQTSLYFMFESCSKLKYAYIYANQFYALSNTFNNCTELKYGNWSEWNVADNTVLDATFRACYNLTEIDLSGWDIVVATAGSMFLNCYRLRTVDISNMTFASAYANAMFSNCTLLENLPQLRGSFTNLTNVFGGCWSAVGEIDWSELDLTACTGFSTPLSYCKMIRKVTIPDGLPTIPQQAFRDMQRCLEYHMLATTPPTLSNASAFNYGTMDRGRKIYVPYSADHSVLNAYLTATNWSSLSAYIVEEDPS